MPALYLALGVPDTVEGRFEALCLHVVLVLRHLRRLPAPAADIAQDLVNSVFAQLDSSLRELGVGDMGVSKRMKKLAQAFYGRAAAYDARPRCRRPRRPGGGARPQRAGPGRARRGQGARYAAYVAAADAALAGTDLDALMATGPVLPDPAGFADHAL